HDDAAEKNALPAELITDRPADEQEGREKERVRFDHPLDFSDRRAEAFLQGGKSDVHDRPVDERHARRDDRRYQRPLLCARHVSAAAILPCPPLPPPLSQRPSRPLPPLPRRCGARTPPARNPHAPRTPPRGF